MPISRSENMRRIKSRDTKPEIFIRKTLRNLGYSGYRLYRRDLPGKPDIAFIGKRKVIFVHGCFWHKHDCKIGSRLPKTNTEYWKNKLENNRLRDIRNAEQLTVQGWDYLELWECELKNTFDLEQKISAFMHKNG